MSEAVAEAPAEVTPQAAEATPPNDEQEADALLAEIEEAKGTPATTDADTPGDDEPADELEQAAIEARAAELAEQKARELAEQAESKRKEDDAKAARKAEEEAQKTQFDDYMARLQYFIGDKLAGEDAEAIAKHFRAFNGLIAPIAQRQLQRDLSEAAGLEDYEWTDVATFIKDVAESRKSELTKGMVPEAKAKSEKALALLQHEKRLATDPQYRDQRFSRYHGAADRQGGNTSVRFTSEADLHRAFNQGQIDRTVYASEYKRLTGRDV